MKLILIKGYKHHGKSTFAKKLSLEKNIPVFSFATHLKKQVHSFLNVPMDYPKDQFLPHENKTLRDYYKETALFYRQSNPEYYVEKLFETLLQENITQAIIDDFRFNIEIEYLRNKNVEIETIHIINKQGLIPHIHDLSEHELDAFICDFVIGLDFNV
mgnify:CR=1 FL=1